MLIQLEITGIILILLGLIHVGFPRYFKWKQELLPLSMMNRQMMYVHSFFIGFVVLLMGLLCLTSARELIGTTLGKRICLGFGLFWTARLIIQFFGYSTALWKGKVFETAIHIFFSILWSYLSVLFILNSLNR